MYHYNPRWHPSKVLVTHEGIGLRFEARHSMEYVTSSPIFISSSQGPVLEVGGYKIKSRVRDRKQQHMVQ